MAASSVLRQSRVGLSPGVGFKRTPTALDPESCSTREGSALKAVVRKQAKRSELADSKRRSLDGSSVRCGLQSHLRLVTSIASSPFSQNPLRSPTVRRPSTALYDGSVPKRRTLGGQVLAKASAVEHQTQSSESTETGAEHSVERPLEDAKIQRLRDWLGQLGWDDCGLAIVGEGVGSYRAVAYGEEVCKEDELVQVPEAALMTAESAARCPTLGPLIIAHSLNPWQTLSAHLLREHARSDSFWSPYLAAIPSESDMRWAHPLLWATEERGSWLQGSPTLGVLENRLEQCRSDFEALQAAGVSAALANEFGREVVTEGSVRWAAAILLSRAFSLEIHVDREEPTLALVPWADLLNHSSEATSIACLVFDDETRFAILGAHKEYRPGEEVYDSYGPGLSPGQLFLDYGFVDWENVSDVADLPSSMLGEVTGKANRALLQGVGLPPESTVFSLSPSELDDTVLAWARAATATSDELAAAGWAPTRVAGRAAAARALAYFVEPATKRNELQALLLLIRACDEQLKGYPSSKAESDVEDRVPDDPDGDRQLAARKTAEQLVLSEQRAIAGARKLLLRQLQVTKASPSEHPDGAS